VSALLILLLGTFAALRMPVDIFPSINIPIIAVAFHTRACRPSRWRDASSPHSSVR
jgi:multidrug efflux pump subunit AcrB